MCEYSDVKLKLLYLLVYRHHRRPPACAGPRPALVFWSMLWRAHGWCHCKGANGRYSQCTSLSLIAVFLVRSAYTLDMFGQSSCGTCW